MSSLNNITVRNRRLTISVGGVWLLQSVYCYYLPFKPLRCVYRHYWSDIAHCVRLLCMWCVSKECV